MTGNGQAPFSSRNRGSHRQVDSDFPESARVGLLHLLNDLEKKNYVESWQEVGLELRRIARLPPISASSPKADAQKTLGELPWERVYDFCERLHGHLAVEVGYRDDDGDFHVTTAMSNVQAFIATELQRLFLEEGLALA